MPAEPALVALFLVACGLLMATAVLSSRSSGRLGVPLALVFLGIGMLAGSEGVGGIAFEDYRLAFRFGTVALVLILFDGGLNTPPDALRRHLAPAATLATVGVLLTAALAGLAARAAGLDWTGALLAGAIVSSTDAAAVFPVLRGSGVQPQRRVGLVLELESGLNDPTAVLLVLALTQAAATGEPPGWSLAWQIPLQLAVGAAMGLGLGHASRRVLSRVRPMATGMYPVLTVSAAFLAFGLTTLAQGSGFLAVYVAALVLGGHALPYRAGVLRVHDALAWFAQVSMFLMLGLLAFPSRLVAAAPVGLALGAALILARLAATAACLAPFRLPVRETLYVGWTGLRGAVPIVLATIPVLAGVPHAQGIFDVVFFVVVMNALVPGATVRRATRWLGLELPAAPMPAAVLEIASLGPLHGEVLGFHVDRASPVRDASMADIPFPQDSAAMLVVRGEELLAPRGSTVLREGDHVFVFCRPADRGFVQLMFGRSEED